MLVLAVPSEKRYVLKNPAIVPEGCTLVKEHKKVTSIKCPESIGSARSLSEDLQAFAVDSAANSQVNADDVQKMHFDGKGTTIAVIDSGVQCSHPELAGSCESGWDFVNNDSDASDDNGHGTHVAGIITANGLSPHAKGAAPKATVKAYKVLRADGGGFFSDIIEAIYAAADSPEVDVLSMSLGTLPPYLWKNSDCDNASPEMTAAVNYALLKGKVVVAAAGNSGSAGVSLPGCISNVLTVGAVDSKDRIASFSGRGFAMKEHGVTAPGVAIYSTWIGGGYATESGTSMATPLVSALVALVKQKNSSTTPQLVRNLFFSKSKDLGKRSADIDYGNGRVDAVACVKGI